MAERASSKSATDSAPETVVVAEVASDQQPIVYERKKKKGKRKKKYSRGLKEPQRLEKGISRAAERIADAVADGFSEYRDRRDKSAGKKRDGAIKDAVRNVGRGLEEAIGTAAKVPTDLTKRMSGRRLTRMVPLPLFR
ncbi:MAG TPA: hypothetical protein VLV54_02710 [Thermoanaerobaculia bacterium]|nr:hypothetical protein [Thermoanaerobaculia bacterium]